MLGVIKPLPKDVINQIAAGEIIHEPSSVLKELLENSIDANSTAIEIFIENGGKNLVQVVDNGQGMVREDAINCCEKHATSKLSTFCDLECLSSMGFRGEALASIAAVCDMEIKTSVNSELTGTHVLIDAGKIISVNDCVFGKGSCFSIKNLFYNLPARRAFLKSDGIEYNKLIKEFYKIAIANHNIKFTLFNNDKLVYDLSKDNLKSRIISLFGDKFKQKLLNVDEKLENLQIHGFIERPESVTKYKTYQYVFVNNRFIQNSALKTAILSAFDGVIASKAQPSYFIFINIPPSEIDINIHPQKTEVKFTDVDTIVSLLTAAIKRPLGMHYKVPLIDFSIDSSAIDFVPVKNVAAPDTAVNKDYNPFSTADDSSSGAISYYDLESFATDNSLSDSQKDSSYLPPLYLESTPKIFNDLEIVRTNKTSVDKKITIKNIVRINNNYVLAIVEEGIYVINSRRAIRRIIYERYLKKVTIDKQPSQTLLYEQVYNLASHNYNILVNNNKVLQELGFIFDLRKENTLVVKALPGFLEALSSETNEVIDSIIEVLSVITNKSAKSILLDILVRSVANKVSVNRYINLTPAELIPLLEELFQYKDPHRSICEKKNYTYINIHNIIKDLNNQ